MHRAYVPLKPTCSRFLQRDWDATKFEKHREQIARTKAGIDNKPPRIYPHLHLKLKKMQLESLRLQEIEKDNNILLEKISHILRTGGRIDNKNLSYEPYSKSKQTRQRELLRLTHENVAMMKRINARQPHYNHHEWESQWLITLKNMESFACYPLLPLHYRGVKWREVEIAAKRSVTAGSKRSHLSRPETSFAAKPKTAPPNKQRDQPDDRPPQQPAEPRPTSPKLERPTTPKPREKRRSQRLSRQSGGQKQGGKNTAQGCSKETARPSSVTNTDQTSSNRRDDERNLDVESHEPEVEIRARLKDEEHRR